MSDERPKLRPAAEFLDRALADEAWALLMEEGIPVTLEHTPRSFGQGGYTRVYVPDADLDAAQALLGDLVRQDRAT